jgi:RNA polymerase sigma factor (TIGR02999 family)
MSGEEKKKEPAITALLQAVQGGDAQAAGELLVATYQEVRKLAELALKGERPDHTLQPTALVHEVMQYFLKGDIIARLKDRQHYFATMRQAMRHVLIDYERHRKSIKAGGQLERLPMRSSILAVEPAKALSPLELLELLEKLAGVLPRASEVVTLHILEGLPQAEVAERWSISLTTVESDWRLARAWLRRALDRERS